MGLQTNLRALQALKGDLSFSQLPSQNHKPFGSLQDPLLGGSLVVINGVISPLVWAIITVSLLITPLITTHGQKPSGYTFMQGGSRLVLQGRRRTRGITIVATVVTMHQPQPSPK